jgi:hypothetical protein
MPEKKILHLCYTVISGQDSEAGATMYLSFPVMPNEESYEVYANPVALRNYIDSLEAT